MNVRNWGMRGQALNKQINEERSGVDQMDNATVVLIKDNDNDSNRDQAKVTVTGRSFKVEKLHIRLEVKSALNLI